MFNHHIAIICDFNFCTERAKKQQVGAIQVPTDTNLIKEYDHLNNDQTDNRLENLVHAHRICNRQKMLNNIWIIKAKTKLRDNERSAIVLPIAHTDTDRDITVETETNNIFAVITSQTLSYYLQRDGDNPPRAEFVSEKKFLDLVTAKAYKITGHASQVTMRRVLDMFCTPEFQYVKQRDEKWHWIIRLRHDDEYS